MAAQRQQAPIDDRGTASAMAGRYGAYGCPVLPPKSDPSMLPREKRIGR